MADPTVKCPNCGKPVPLTKALTQQIEDTLRKQLDREAKAREKELQANFKEELELELQNARDETSKAAAKQSSRELEALTGKLTEANQREKALRDDFQAKLDIERKALEKEAAKQAEESMATKLTQLRRTNRDKNKKIRELEDQASDLEKKEVNLSKREDAIESELERKTNRARKDEREEVSKQFARTIQELELERDTVSAELRQKLAEANAKLDQRSQQLKGEIVEIEFERLLAETCPEDVIDPVKKGKRGADIIQKVMSPSGRHSGTIIWETKNAKNWAKTWVSKLRTDQRRAKADIAVLVSKVFPKDIEPSLGQKNGVWIADYTVVPGLALALRQSLIDLYRLQRTADATEEMEILYAYLISKDFRQRVEAIVDAFNGMRENLDKEKSAMELSWARRERHIAEITKNVAGMIGDIQAITSAFPPIKRLELPPPD